MNSVNNFNEKKNDRAKYTQLQKTIQNSDLNPEALGICGGVKKQVYGVTVNFGTNMKMENVKNVVCRRIQPFLIQ